MESASVKCNSEEASLRSDSFITSIKAELALTPKDLHLHETLLKRYLSINEVDKAFDHAYNVEFSDKIFNNDLNWYKMLHKILLCDSDKNQDWLYQVLLLTITERICSLNLSEKFKSRTDITEFLHAYDQAIYKVISLGPSLGLKMFHTAMLDHHKGQIALHSATFLLLQNRYYTRPDARVVSLMLMAWQTVPSNLRRNWLRHSPEKQILALNSWYIEGTYRCSQAGHYCLHLIKTLSLQLFTSCCLDEFRYDLDLFDAIAITSTKTTYFGSGAIGPHSHILPKQFEVEAYDKDAQKEYPHSLHHMLWTILKYEKVADFKCTLFDKLNFSSMDSEHALNKLDIYAFLYCVTLTARNNGNDIGTLPANITSILCSDVQAKWWERAYEYYTNKVESDLIGIDATFAYGIKVIRCIGNNKLDPKLLYNLGCIFSERAEKSTDIKETHQLKERASLYYQTALLFLQKLINTSVENVTQYRDITMFNYVCKDMNDIEVKHLLKECKIGIIKNNVTYGEYQTLYNLAHTYKRNALIFNDLKLKDKVTVSLFKAKTFASKALNKLLELEANINVLFYTEIQELIQEIEMAFKSFEINSTNLINSKYSENESIPATNSNLFTDANSSWFEEYCKSMKKNIAFHFNLLESAINQVNDKIDKFKNVTADFQCLKKQITELEVRVFKNSSLGQTYIGRNSLPLPGLSTTSTVSSISVGTTRTTPAISENSLSVNLRNNENFSLIKPSIFLGNEKKYTGMFALSKTTYFSDLVSNKNSALPVSVPGAQSMFDPTRSQVNNCSVYPTPDQIYSDRAYLVPPNVPAVPIIPRVVTVPSMAASSIPPPVTYVKSVDTKDTARSLPMNVVITSSDPLPTTTPAPALSLTIPPKNIKETSHNYQIAMPSTNETNIYVSPPAFVFPQNKTTIFTGTFANWNNPSVFKTTSINTTSTVQSILQDTLQYVPKISADTLNTSRTVVDGLFGISTPNTSLNKSWTVSEKSNTSVENYDPCPDFKPIVTLPAEIKVTTEEEDEITIFNSRAKLFHFIDKQWKERGIGEMKLLKHKTTGKVRVLMRREQSHKICANHIITADMEIKPMENETKAYFWVANDFADDTVVLEKFCIRFKAANIVLDFYNSFENARLALLCDQFIEAVKAAQAKMKDESKSAQEEQNAAIQTAQTGFVNKFKPKSGSWHCDTCYTNNLENFNKCACCETPKPKSNTEIKTITSAPTDVTITVGRGHKFKPKAGSWECQSCLVGNEGTLESFTACNSSEDPTEIKTSSTPVKPVDNTTKLNFGIPPSTAVATAAVKSESTGQVLFKPNPVAHKKSIFYPPTINDQKSNEEASTFDVTGAQKFSFRIPSNNHNNSEVSAVFGEKAYYILGTQKIATDSAPIDFTVKKNIEQTTLTTPASLPTPQTDSATSFFINEDCKFNYVFKPKMGKSPVKSPLKDKGDESEDNEYVAEDECNHSFTPVIPLQDKVEVVTGEENEIELYGHLAKLYRFNSSEWKERGKGIVKILKHKETGKLRVVMRRDQVLKICLNHLLTSEVNYTAKEEKSWLFSVNDFSEGELSLEYLCLRFKNKEIASQFKEAVDKAVQGGSLDTVNTKPTILAKGDSVYNGGPLS